MLAKWLCIELPAPGGDNGINATTYIKARSHRCTSEQAATAEQPQSEMNLFKIAFTLAAVCSVADTHSKGRDIVLWFKANTAGQHPIYKRLSCIHKGFHPPNNRPPPSVTVELVNTKTPNASVSCYEPGEEYNGKAVIICTASYHSFAACTARLDKCN